MRIKQELLSSLQQQRQANANNKMSVGPGQMQNQQRPGAPQMVATLSNPGVQVPQAFNPQLRQPMQASPLPGTVQNTPNLGAQGMMAPQMQNQASQQGAQPQAQQQQLSAAIVALTRQRTQDLMQRASPAKIELGKQWVNNLPPDKRQQIQQSGLILCTITSQNWPGNNSRNLGIIKT
jgi:hypothetical protein